MPKKLISYDEDAPTDPLPIPVRDWLDGRYIQATAYPYDIAFPHSSAQRQVGAGELPDGIRLDRDVTFTKIIYLAGTNDSSGSSTVEIRKNGVAVAGTSGSASTSPTAVTGSFVFAPGDILTVHITAVSGTAGQRLTAFLTGTTQD